MKKATQSSGFTLVELLFVVAVIGYLSSIAVPSYRRFVQKARQVEARVGLASVARQLKAFSAEYGTYGSNLRWMGVEFDHELIATASVIPTVNNYSIGFFAKGGCKEVKIFPTNSDDPRFIKTNPTYQLNGTAGWVAAQPDAVKMMKNCRTSTISRNQFELTATGAIAPSVDLAAPLADLDQWTINEKSSLVHVNDGVK